jgi:hypothetical protein
MSPAINPADLPRRYQDQVAASLVPTKKNITAVEVAVATSTDETRLNKTEAAFLAYLRGLGVQNIAIQAVTFKIGDDCRYTPDFISVNEGRIEAWEVKGFFRDDAKVKIKVAARMFRWVCFVLVFREKGGGWTMKRVLP